MKTRYLLAVLPLLLVASCAHQPPPVVPDAPGFFAGLWHGAIAPVAFVIGLFGDARVYAFPNSGGWYDLGFLLGICAWSGGGAAAGRRRRRG